MIIKYYISLNKSKDNKIEINLFKYKIIINNILMTSFLFIGRYLYVKSLKGCDGDEFKCTKSLKYIVDDLYNCIYSSAFFLISL